MYKISAPDSDENASIWIMIYKLWTTKQKTIRAVMS